MSKFDNLIILKDSVKNLTNENPTKMSVLVETLSDDCIELLKTILEEEVDTYPLEVYLEKDAFIMQWPENEEIPENTVYCFALEMCIENSDIIHSVARNKIKRLV